MANKIETSSKNIKPWINLNHNICLPVLVCNNSHSKHLEPFASQRWQTQLWVSPLLFSLPYQYFRLGSENFVISECILFLFHIFQNSLALLHSKTRCTTKFISPTEVFSNLHNKSVSMV